VADPTPGVPSAARTSGQNDGQPAAVPPVRVAEDREMRADQGQRVAPAEQRASEHGPAAAATGVVHGGDPDAHGFSRHVRDRNTRQRRQGADGRVEAAALRDGVAHARDASASARDEAAVSRDAQMTARDAAWADDARSMSGAEVLLRASDNRRRSAADRIAAAETRVRAADDREQSTLDREQAAGDRAQAQADLDALLYQLSATETDPLTGARTRAAGLADLDHEVDRARRTTGQLTVAYVDVVGLKRVNDARGHAAGDALLRRAVQTMDGHLRTYDSIVRLGGDEFLCVMSDTTLPDARERFRAVQTALRADAARGEINVGFAALGPQESAADLIGRADAQLLSSRRR
jgi:diguanylate cyclase